MLSFPNHLFQNKKMGQWPIPTQYLSLPLGPKPSGQQKTPERGFSYRDFGSVGLPAFLWSSQTAEAAPTRALARDYTAIKSHFAMPE